MSLDKAERARIIRAAIRTLQSQRLKAEGDVKRAQERLQRLDGQIAAEREALTALEAQPGA